MGKKRRLILFFAVSAVFNMAASFVHPVTPTIFKDLGLGDYMFGVALAAMMTINFLFSPFWGKINGFLSSRVSLFISCGGYALGQLFFGLAQTEAQFLCARMFAGIFTGGCFVSILTYIVNTVPDERRRGQYLAANATIQSVGGAFGYFVGGLIGIAGVYYAVAAQVITLFICGVIFYFICENDASVSIKEVQFREVAKEANPFAAFIASRNFMTVTLVFLFAMCALQNLGQTAFDQSFNYYIKDQFNFSSAYNGLLKGVMGFITLIANGTICIWLINKTDLKKSIIYVLLLCSVTMYGVIAFENIIPFIIIFVIFFAFSAISMPLLQNLVADNAHGSDSNLIMGFYNSMKSLGGIFGALFSGVFYTANPKYPFIFGFSAFLVAAGCAVTYNLLSRKKVSGTLKL